MSLIRLRDVSASFGGPPVLQQANLAVDEGERVCLVGRNGTGKSTLLKLIAGFVQVDGGEIERRQSIRIAYLHQEPPSGLSGTIFDIVAQGLGEQAALLQAFHHASHALAEENSAQALENFERAQHAVEAAGAWQLNQQVETVLSRMSLDGDAAFEQLSGGMKRRVLLAQALVNEPNMLLLDEPTNHLDLNAIQWLEQQLQSFSGALLFVTHDRAFLRKLATRIVELDRGQLTSYPGDYGQYLRRKQENLQVETEANARFDKKLAQEEIWIRQGIKARRTRNEGRVRALQKLRNERQLRRERVGKVDMKIAQAEQSGKLIVEAEQACFGYSDELLIKNLNTTILRGDKVGIIGPNGAGKTTLLKLLLGDLEPKSGRIRLGVRQSIAYFDQLREQLDENASVIDNISQGRERIEINGKQKHVIGYLQDFLFSPDRVRSPVKSLSGGERNRLLLARLFSTPANILVLDEPTNDLDVETLELLEELVLDFPGTVLLVSHDREFLNNVATSTLVFEHGNEVNEYVGGYDDWLRQRKLKSEQPAQQAGAEKPAQKTGSNKLSYKDQRELDALPGKIEKLEHELEQLRQQMAAPEFFKRQKQEIVALKSQLQDTEQKLNECYRRWEQLESGD